MESAKRSLRPVDAEGVEGAGSKPLSVRHLRLTAFNYASYPTLCVPRRRVCLDLLQRGCSSHQ